MVPDPAISADGRMHVKVELKSFYSTAIDFKKSGCSTASFGYLLGCA
jgi:hypothetical protein